MISYSVINKLSFTVIFLILALLYLLQESFNRLSYLLDVFTFTQDDMSLNSTVLNWPKNIAPIFDQNDEVFILFLQKCNCM